MSSSAELKIPFNDFFEKYFKDESGSYPECSEGRTWFVETMTGNQFSKFLDKKFKVNDKHPEITIDLPTMILDKSLFKTLDRGVILELDGTDYYKIMMRELSDDWEVIEELKSAYYDESDNSLTINGYEVSFSYKIQRFYAERLANCINAYLEQNEETKEEVTFNSELVTDALDNIDERISEIKEKLASLQAPEEKAS